VALIVIGLLALLGQLFPNSDYGLILVPLLGLIFLIWGAAARRVGLLIPGGILLGIGVGAFLVERVLTSANDQVQGGVFLLAFAAGWALITVASALFTDRTHRWPLIVAAVLGIIGLALLVVGPAVSALANSPWVWSIVLILVGLYLLLFRRGRER
jgi:hypothetical protein